MLNGFKKNIYIYIQEGQKRTGNQSLPRTCHGLGALPGAANYILLNPARSGLCLRRGLASGGPLCWECSLVIPTSYCHTPRAFCPNVTLLQIATTSLSQPLSTPTCFIFHEINSHCLKPQCQSCCHSLLTKFEPLGLGTWSVVCIPGSPLVQRRGSVGASSIGWLSLFMWKLCIFRGCAYETQLRAYPLPTISEKLRPIAQFTEADSGPGAPELGASLAPACLQGFAVGPQLPYLSTVGGSFRML